MRSRAISKLIVFGVGVLLTATPALDGQDPASIDTTTFAPAGVSPGGAFLRAVLIPGWGHTSIGSHTRAGFYLLLEGTTAYGLIRTQSRIDEVETRAALRERGLRATLAADGITDTEEIETAVEADEELEDLRSLAESRGQQREDWAALGIFLLFLSGADAYVSAHLQNFPAPIEIDGGPIGNGRMEIGVRIPVGN